MQSDKLDLLLTVRVFAINSEIFLKIDNPKSGVTQGEYSYTEAGGTLLSAVRDDTSMLNINVGASIVESWTY